MSGFIRHYLVRLRECFRNPWALVVLVASSAISFVVWPSATGVRGLASEYGENSFLELVTVGIFIWLWCALPAVLVKGRASGGKLVDMFAGQAMPTLPVGPKSRVLAEVLVVITFLVPLRAAGGAVFNTGDFFEFMRGLAIILPIMIAWATPAKTSEGYFLRPFVLVVAAWAYMKLGFYSTPVLAFGSAVVFTTVALMLVGREFSAPSYFTRRYRDPRFFFRPHMDPKRRLRCDAFSLSFSRFWLFLVIMFSIEFAVLILDRIVVLPRGIVYFCTSLTVSLIAFLVGLRPFGSKTIAYGLMGATRSSPGDFIRAWSLLPVKRESVLRVVFANAFIATVAAVAFGVAIIGYYAMLRGGQFAIVDEDGDSVVRMLFPMFAMILIMPAAAVSGARGSKIAGVLYLGYGMFLLMFLSIALTAVFKGVPHRDGIIIAIESILTLALCLPQLRHLFGNQSSSGV